MKNKFYISIEIKVQYKNWLYISIKFERRKSNKKTIEYFIKEQIHENFSLYKKNKVFYIEILNEGPSLKRRMKRKRIIVNRLS